MLALRLEFVVEDRKAPVEDGGLVDCEALGELWPPVDRDRVRGERALAIILGYAFQGIGGCVGARGRVVMLHNLDMENRFTEVDRQNHLAIFAGAGLQRLECGKVGAGIAVQRGPQRDFGRVLQRRALPVPTA